MVDADEGGSEALRGTVSKRAVKELVKGNTSEPARLQPGEGPMVEPMKDRTRMEPETRQTEGWSCGR